MEHTTDAHPERSCEGCGDSFTSEWPATKYCSKRCKKRAEGRRAAARKRAGRATVQVACEHCSGMIVNALPHQRFCTEACKEAHRRGVRTRSTIAEVCIGCGRSDGLDWWVGRIKYPGSAGCRCERCYAEYQRERTRTPRTAEQRARQIERYHDTHPPRVCPGCGEEHRHGGKSRCADCAHDHRKSLRSAAEARRLDVVRAGDQDIHWTLLGERDGWVCHICSKRVPKVAGTAEQPMGATVDHLIPIAHGGEHLWANVALAHRSCNISRGVGGAAQLRLVG